MLKEEITKASEICFEKVDKITYKPWTTEVIIMTMKEITRCKILGDQFGYRKYTNMINREVRKVREDWLEHWNIDVKRQMIAW